MSTCTVGAHSLNQTWLTDPVDSHMAPYTSLSNILPRLAIVYFFQTFFLPVQVFFFLNKSFNIFISHQRMRENHSSTVPSYLPVRLSPFMPKSFDKQ